jgi:HlyD family secretion protein
MKKISFALLFFLIGCKDNIEKTAPTIENITVSIYASGSLKSENQYQVFAKSSGILNQILVQEGDLVKTNQLLFSIYNETSSLSRQNAQLVANFNSFNNNRDKLTDLKSSIELAKNRMQNDSLNYARQKALYQQQAIAKANLEQSELQYLNSKTNYNSTKIKYDDLKRQLSYSDEQAKRNLAISENLESDFMVKSEIIGKVYAILKEKGEMISPQVPLAIIGDANNFIIQLQIDENDISSIEKGQLVILSLDSYPGKTFEATITKINPYLNERSKTFLVEAKFKQQPQKLYPNLSLEANIIVSKKEKALLIPRSYLIDEQYVMNEKGEKIKIKIGLKNFEKVEVLEGLTKNDIIIIPVK